MKLPAATQLLAFWPDPGEGAQSVEITSVTPDGQVTPLLWISQFQPQWRSPFYLESPVALPRGSRLLMTTYFENDGAAPQAVRPQAWIATAPLSRQPSARQK
jgi:hypothetical protein